MCPNYNCFTFTIAGVGISIVSYNGQAKVTMMVDKTIMSDPAILLNNFEDHLEQLAKMLNVL